MNESTLIRIVLISDDRILCDGLRVLFSHESATEVIGETSDGPLAQKRIRELKPDLVITDIASWAGGGLETIRNIAKESLDTKIIVISAFCSKAFITLSLSAGAQGYVAKKNGFNELLQAVKTVCSGAAFLCSSAREVVLGDYAIVGNPGKIGNELLTDRECAILQLLAEGRTSKQVGLMLNVSSKTIDACRRRLMKKLNVESLAGLVKCAIVMGFTTVSPLETQLEPLSYNSMF